MIILLLDMVSMMLYKNIIVVVSGLILKVILTLHVKLLKINLLSLKVIFFKILNTIKVLFILLLRKLLKNISFMVLILLNLLEIISILLVLPFMITVLVRKLLVNILQFIRQLEMVNLFILSVKSIIVFIFVKVVEVL